MLRYPEEIRRKVKEYQKRHTAWIYGIKPTVSMPATFLCPTVWSKVVLIYHKKDLEVYSDSGNYAECERLD